MIALQSLCWAWQVRHRRVPDLLPTRVPSRRGQYQRAAEGKINDVALSWDELSSASLDEVLAAWRHQRDAGPTVEAIKPRDIKAAAATITEVFFDPSPLSFLNGMMKSRLKIEVADGIRVSLRYRGKGDFALLVVWDEQRETVLGAIQVSRQDEAELTRQLPDTEESCAYISSMAVLPYTRRRGIGSALLEAAEFVAWTWGENEIVLHVYEDNESALRLYRNSGYEEIQDQKDSFFGFLSGPRILLLRRKW